MPNAITGKLILPIILCAMAGMLAMLPAYIWGIPAGADLDNHFRSVQPFYDELAAGNLMPGWLAESNNGFGDARFRFYPPMLYYVLSAMRLLAGDWYAATLITFTVLSIIGAIGVFAWAREHLPPWPSVFAACLFAFTPYHLAQFYQASLLAEFAGTSILPFAFLYVGRLTAGSRRRTASNIAGLAVAYSLIVTTHLPTAVIGSLALGIFALCAINWKDGKRALVYCTLGVGLALLMSSWFWVKLLAELDWIQGVDPTRAAYYDYRNNFLFSPFSPPNLNTWYGALIAVLTLAIVSPALVILPRIFGSRALFNSETCRVLRAAAIVAALSLIMTTDLSRPIWTVVPKLADVQFPYRWLAVTAILICPLVAASIALWQQRLRVQGLRPLHLPLFTALSVALIYGVYDLAFQSEFRPRSVFLARLPEIRGARSFTDWLPRGAAELKDLEPMAGQIDASGREVVTENVRSDRRVFSLGEGDTEYVRIRTYRYPLWTAAILAPDGGRVSAATSQALDGTLLVAVPPEKVTIELLFTEPTRTRSSVFVSAVGWLLSFGLLLFGFLNSRRASGEPDQ